MLEAMGERPRTAAVAAVPSVIHIKENGDMQMTTTATDHEAQSAGPADDSVAISPEERQRREELVREMKAKWREHDLRVKDLLDRQEWSTATGPDDPLLMLYVRVGSLDEEQYGWLRLELIEQAARVFLARGATPGDVRRLADINRGAPGVDLLAALFDEVADMVARIQLLAAKQ
jgi:hypothetical protein